MESDAWGEFAEFEPTMRKIPLEGWRYGSLQPTMRVGCRCIYCQIYWFSTFMGTMHDQCDYPRYRTVRFQHLYSLGLRKLRSIPSRWILGSGVDNIDNCGKVSHTSSQPEKGNSQAGFKLAPPTKNPSMSFCFASSLQFFSLTEPP